MSIDLAAIAAILALIVSGPLAWIVRGLLQDVKELERQLSDHRMRSAERYVEKDDLHRELAEIKAMLRELFGVMRNAARTLSSGAEK